MDPNLLLQLAAGKGGYQQTGPTPYDIQADPSVLERAGAALAPPQPAVPKPVQFMSSLASGYAAARPGSPVAETLRMRDQQQASKDEQAFKMLMELGGLTRRNAMDERERLLGRDQYLAAQSQGPEVDPDRIVDYGEVTGRPELMGVKGPLSGLRGSMPGIVRSALGGDESVDPSTMLRREQFEYEKSREGRIEALLTQAQAVGGDISLTEEQRESKLREIQGQLFGLDSRVAEKFGELLFPGLNPTDRGVIKPAQLLEGFENWLVANSQMGYAKKATDWPGGWDEAEMGGPWPGGVMDWWVDGAGRVHRGVMPDYRRQTLLPRYEALANQVESALMGR